MCLSINCSCPCCRYELRSLCASAEACMMALLGEDVSRGTVLCALTVLVVAALLTILTVLVSPLHAVPMHVC